MLTTVYLTTCNRTSTTLIPSNENSPPTLGKNVFPLPYLSIREALPPQPPTPSHHRRPSTTAVVCHRSPLFTTNPQVWISLTLCVCVASDFALTLQPPLIPFRTYFLQCLIFVIFSSFILGIEYSWIWVFVCWAMLIWQFIV